MRAIILMPMLVDAPRYAFADAAADITCLMLMSSYDTDADFVFFFLAIVTLMMTFCHAYARYFHARFAPYARR